MSCHIGAYLLLPSLLALLSYLSFGFEPLHQIIIVLVQYKFFRIAPISIGHLPISLCLVRVKTAPISIGHRLFSLSFGFWGYTYINRSSSYQFVFGSSWDCTYINRSFILLVQLEFKVTHISIGYFRVSLKFQFLGPHLYRSVIHLVFSLVFGVTPILINHFPISLCSI